MDVTQRWMAVVLVTCAASGSFAATDRSQWDCAEASCTERMPHVFATLTGTFLHGAGLDGAADADRIAALEQQSLRAFEYVSNAPAVVSADIRIDESYRPEGWTGGAPAVGVEVLKWVSHDGETYSRLAPDAVVQEGDALLVGVRQARNAKPGAAATYYPARFTLTLAQRRVRVDAGWELDPEDYIAPTPVSADGDPEPEEPAGAADVPPVAGSAQFVEPTAPCAAPDCAAANTLSSPAVHNDLAAELQRELARIGCYRAGVDGLWGPASRRAVLDFNTGAAARLDPAAPTPAALVAVARAQGTVCAGN